MKKTILFLLAALFAASPILAQSITTSPLVVGPLPANFASAYQNLPFSGSITSFGIVGGIPPYTCSKVSGAFPTGIADVTSGCLVSGTPTGTTAGTEVVNVSDSGNSTVTLAITINVATLSSILVNSSITSILSGNTLQLTCTSTWSDLSSKDLTSIATWASSNTGIFTINSSGLLTAVAAGSANATCAFNSMTSANLAITVTSTNPVIVQTASLPNCQQNLTYQAPIGFQLVATGGTPPYTWTQTGGTLPTGLTLSSAGIISGSCTGSTAASLVFKATDTLSANGSSGSLTLTVATLSSIAVTPSTPTISAGTQQQFVGTGTYSDGSTANLTSVSGGITSNLALVNKASTGSSGTTSVTSVSTTGTGGTGAISVTAGNLLWVECHHGTNQTTTCTPSDTAVNTFTPIATVTNAGEGFLETFYAKNITGNASDVVTCTFNTSVQFASCGVHQISGASTSAPLDSSSVVSTSGTSGNSAATPSFSTAIANEMEDVAFGVASSSSSVSAGAGYALRVIQSGDTGTGSEDQTFSSIQSGITASISWTGSSLPWLIIGEAFEAATVSTGCQWTSGTPGVATVNGTGLVTSGTGNGGTSTIQCTVGGVNGSTTLTVTPVGITSLTIAPPSATLTIGQQASFTCTDNNGNNLTASATFGSNNSGVFLFGTPNGTGTAQAAGSATATCSASGVTSNAATITVPVSGQILNAASCNPADIQSQLNLATGPTTIVIVPSGTCTWASTLTFGAPAAVTSLTLQGQTTCTGSGDPAFNNLVCTDNTTIIDSAAGGGSQLLFIAVRGTSTFLRVTGFTFTPGTAGTRNNGRVVFSAGSGNVRIDHNHFNNVPNKNGGTNALFITDCTRGVIDHNIFNSNGLSGFMITPYNSVNCNGSTNADYTWSIPTGFGTSDFIFVEQNLFTDPSDSGSAQADDCLYGGKVVWRFNTMFNGAHIQTHPTDSVGNGRGCRATEYYGNTNTINSTCTIFISNGTSCNPNTVFFHSSGPAMFWGNSISALIGHWNGMVQETDCRSPTPTTRCGYATNAPPANWGPCNGTSGWDKNTGNGTNAGYPCIDQAGRGQSDLLSGSFPSRCDASLPSSTVGACGNGTYTGVWPNQKLEPMYYFLNLAPGGSFPGGIFSQGGAQTINVDWYQSSDPGSGTDCTGFTGATGVGCGARASRPATCTTGVAWWSSDQGGWNGSGNGFGNGVLDICTATNTWTNGAYVPYTYPHPLDH